MPSPITSDPGVQAKITALTQGLRSGPADTGAPDPAHISAAIHQLAGNILGRGAVGGAAVAGTAPGAGAESQGDTSEATNALRSMVQQLRQEREADRAAALQASGQVKRLQAEFDPTDPQGPMGEQGEAGQAMPAAAAPGGAGGAGGASGEFQPNEEMETLSTLSKHMDKVPNGLKFGDLDKLSKDESLPPDLREAYAKLKDNPELLARLDNADLGGSRIKQRRHRDDENIGHGDLRKAFNDPALVEYNRQKAEGYTQNYVPSDVVEGDTTPRAMTASDASRELYLYADSLPDNIDRKELQRIVDGQCRGKCPAQLQAAAQYMLDNPEAFAKIAPEGKVSRGALENNALESIHLRGDEVSALRTMQANKDLFMRDGEFATRESLGKLAADESVPKDVRDAAAMLASNPLLFGMLDNGDKGHEASRKNKTHDGKISGGDIDKCLAKLNSTNLTPQKLPPASADAASQPQTALQAAAVEDMVAGVVDDPATKESRGGKKGLGILKGILNVVGKVLDWVKVGLDALASVLPPPFSAIAAGIGAGVATVNNFGVKAGAAMLDGVSAKDAYKQAGKNQAWDMASTGLSMIPGGGIAAKAGLQAGRAAATVGIKEGAEYGIKTGAKEGIEVVAKNGTKEAAEASGKTAVKEGSETTTKQATKEGLKDGAQDIATDEALIAAQNERARRQQMTAQTQADAMVLAQTAAMPMAMPMQAPMPMPMPAAPMAPMTDFNKDPFGVEGEEDEEEEEERAR